MISLKTEARTIVTGCVAELTVDEMRELEALMTNMDDNHPFPAVLRGFFEKLKSANETARFTRPLPPATAGLHGRPSTAFDADPKRCPGPRCPYGCHTRDNG